MSKYHTAFNTILQFHWQSAPFFFSLLLQTISEDVRGNAHHRLGNAASNCAHVTFFQYLLPHTQKPQLFENVVLFQICLNLFSLTERAARRRRKKKKKKITVTIKSTIKICGAGITTNKARTFSGSASLPIWGDAAWTGAQVAVTTGEPCGNGGRGMEGLWANCCSGWEPKAQDASQQQRSASALQGEHVLWCLKSICAR